MQGQLGEVQYLAQGVHSFTHSRVNTSAAFNSLVLDAWVKWEDGTKSFCPSNYLEIVEDPSAV
jgi:hypothetical protein